MQSMVLRLFLMAAVIVPAAGALAGGPATQPSSPALADINGAMQRPLELGNLKAAVILFISTDCPICNGYAPEINRICKEYEARGVGFYLVHADPALADASAKKHAADYGFTCPVLIDRKHEIIRRVGATITPEAVVIGLDGKIAYRGRIDDLYVVLGKRRFEATTHDLRVALDAVLAGKPVPTPQTDAVGCTISD